MCVCVAAVLFGHVMRKRPAESGMLCSHVLVEGLALHLIYTQNGGHEILSVSPQEVKQVAVATVLCDHQHGA